MFGSIGMPELIIILVIALIIFGPRKLPEIGRSLGKSIREFKKTSDELRSTLDEKIDLEQQSDLKATIRAEQETAIAAAAPPPSTTAPPVDPASPPPVDPASPPPVDPASPADETANRTTGTDPVA